MHIDELIAHQDYRRGGVGVWLLAKWLDRVKTSSRTTNGVLPERLADALSSCGNTLARSAVRTDGVVNPYITLCVDEDNVVARAFYRKVGFVELPCSGDCGENCPGRIECVITQSMLSARVAGMQPGSQDGFVPKCLKSRDRTRIEFTGPELESLLMNDMPRSVTFKSFSTEDFNRSLEKNDPACTIAAMIADFYKDEFKKAIQEAVDGADDANPNSLAALLPIGKEKGLDAYGKVTVDVVRLFALDRLLMWETPRVIMSASAHADLQDRQSPQRTDQSQWETTRYLMLFDRPKN